MSGFSGLITPGGNRRRPALLNSGEVLAAIGSSDRSKYLQQKPRPDFSDALHFREVGGPLHTRFSLLTSARIRPHRQSDTSRRVVPAPPQWRTRRLSLGAAQSNAAQPVSRAGQPLVNGCQVVPPSVDL